MFVLMLVSLKLILKLFNLLSALNFFLEGKDAM